MGGQAAPKWASDPAQPDQPQEQPQQGAVDRRHADRRQRGRLVLVERRSGFDRRELSGENRFRTATESVLRYLRDRPMAFLLVLLSVNFLNILDLSLTLNALSNGAIEGNPLMRFLLEYSVGAAALFKLALVAGVSLLLWRFRHFRSVLRISLVILAIFAAIFVYQLYGLVGLL